MDQKVISERYYSFLHFWIGQLPATGEGFREAIDNALVEIYNMGRGDGYEECLNNLEL